MPKDSVINNDIVALENNDTVALEAGRKRGSIKKSCNAALVEAIEQAAQELG